MTNTYTAFITGIITGIIEERKELFNPAYLYGSSKHIFQTCSNLAEKNIKSAKKVVWITAEDYYRSLISFLKKRPLSIELFRRQYCPCDLFILEHAEKLSSMQSTQDELYILLDRLLETGTQIVIGASCPPKSIQLLEDRLQTLFEAGIIACAENSVN